MKFILEIECNNDAFAGGQEHAETVSVLASAQMKLMRTAVGELDIAPLYDTNGNTVGSMRFED